MSHTRSGRPMRRAAALLATAAMLLAGLVAVASPASAQTSIRPTGLSASVNASSHVVLTWTPSTDSRVTQQRIVRREPRFAPAWHEVATVTKGDTTYTDMTAVKGRKYIYRVQNMINDKPRHASNRAVILPKDNPAAVTVANPTGLSANKSVGQVVLSWTAGTDTRITDQYVMRRQRGVTTWTEIKLAKDATSHTDSGLTSGQKYIYRIESRGGDRGIGLSNRVAVLVP